MTRSPEPLTPEELDALRPWFASGEDADYPYRAERGHSLRSGFPTDIEVRLLATIDAARSRSTETPDGLDAAWKAAEAALPEGWLIAVGRWPTEPVDESCEAWATRYDDDPSGVVVKGEAATPAAALQALTARLAHNPSCPHNHAPGIACPVVGL